jgi:type IV pilus assembly protein PilE
VVEVCVVLVVLGGLVWLAIPSWLQHRLRLHRVDARTELVSTAQRLTGCFARLGVYDNPACTVALPVATAANTYRLTGEIDAGRFLLRAEPLGEQAEDRECSTYLLDHLGQRSVSGTVPPAQCW